MKQNNWTSVLARLDFKKLHVLFLLLVFFYFEFVYKNFVFEYFHSTGFDFSFSIQKYALGVASITLILGLFYYKQLKPLTYFIGFLVILFLAIPSIVLYQFTSYSILIPLCFIVFQAIIGLSSFKFEKLISKVQKNVKSFNHWFLLILALLMFVPFVNYYAINFDLDLFKFGSRVYEIRSAIQDSGSVLTSYLFSPLAGVLLPFMLAYGIDKKKYYVSGLAILLMIVMYLMLPHKSIFFSIPVVLFFGVIKGSIIRKMNIFIVFILIAFITTRIHSSCYTDGEKMMPESLLVRRTFFVPALLTGVYFKEYKDKPVYLGHSIFKSFVDYPYDREPTKYIGKQFYESEETNANTGIVGDGYMNFGLLGSLFYLLVFSMIIAFLEAFNVKSTYLGIFVLLVLLFQNGSLSTIVLTHGLWMYFALFTLFITNKSAK
ncbi:MAG: hypothetical protein ACJAUV_001798 [Flavobacteriales bacterium]|jgi:hypothetical protein